jgi:hypothetical protein
MGSVYDRYRRTESACVLLFERFCDLKDPTHCLRANLKTNTNQNGKFSLFLVLCFKQNYKFSVLMSCLGDETNVDKKLIVELYEKMTDLLRRNIELETKLNKLRNLGSESQNLNEFNCNQRKGSPNFILI